MCNIKVTKCLGKNNTLYILPFLRMDLVKTKYIFIYNTFFIKSSKQQLLLYVRAISILETDNITITVTVPKKGHA